MSRIPPIKSISETNYNPNRQKSGQEIIEEIDETKDRLELSEIGKISFALKEAEEALALLPTSETLSRKVILLKSRLEELKAKQE